MPKDAPGVFRTTAKPPRHSVAGQWPAIRSSKNIDEKAGGLLCSPPENRASLRSARTSLAHRLLDDFDFLVGHPYRS